MLPFFHIYGIAVFLGMTLNRGNHLVTLPKFEPQMFIDSLVKHKVRHFLNYLARIFIFTL